MPSLGGTVLENARRVPAREALVAGDRRWTWAELSEETGRWAAVLRQLPLAKGDRLAVMAATSPELILVTLAALRLGVIAVPVNARLTAHEVGHILRDCGCAAVAADRTFTSLIAEALDGPVPLLELRPGAADGETPVATDHAAEDDDAFIVYTSGTTGAPKGVLLDHHRAVWAALSQITSVGLRDGERYLHLSPLHHSGGVVFQNAITLLGGTHVLIPGFEAGAVLELVERERITAFLAVPTMLQFLLRHPDLPGRDLSSLRAVVFGAAPMPPAAVEALLAALPHVSLVQMCGQTEAGPTGLYSTTAQVRERPDSTGHQAQPFLRARVVDAAGTDVRPGDVGELVFRGEAVMKGYWGDPAATAEVIRDGWLHTGDLVVVHDDGAMTLVDRLKDVIITGGQNVYSAEVEQALGSLATVADCAVIARPHPEYGQTVVAVVQPFEGAAVTLEDVRAHCARLLAPYKIPRELVVGPVVRNAAGKIQKHLVRERISRT